MHAYPAEEHAVQLGSAPEPPEEEARSFEAVRSSAQGLASSWLGNGDKKLGRLQLSRSEVRSRKSVTGTCQPALPASCFTGLGASRAPARKKHFD